jgi:hypothetical protein
MNARTIPVCACLLLGLAAPPARSGEADPAAAFTQMRLEFAKIQKLEPDAGDAREAIRALAAEGKLDEAAKRAGAWLADHPVDAHAHLIYSAILRGKGDFQGCLKHRFVSQGILESIAASGSGLSQETAMKVINVDEEYLVIRSLGGQLRKQALIKGADGRQYDRMDCTIDGKEVTLHFDVTLWMQAIRRAISPKEGGGEEGGKAPPEKAPPEKAPAEKAAPGQSPAEKTPPQKAVPSRESEYGVSDIPLIGREELEAAQLRKAMEKAEAAYAEALRRRRDPQGDAAKTEREKNKAWGEYVNASQLYINWLLRDAERQSPRSLGQKAAGTNVCARVELWVRTQNDKYERLDGAAAGVAIYMNYALGRGYVYAGDMPEACRRFDEITKVDLAAFPEGAARTYVSAVKLRSTYFKAEGLAAAAKTEADWRKALESVGEELFIDSPGADPVVKVSARMLKARCHAKLGETGKAWEEAGKQEKTRGFLDEILEQSAPYRPVAP